MIWGRPLSVMLADLGDAAIAAAAAAGARPTRMEVDLPVEVRFAADGSFSADMVAFVTRTPFDLPLSRLRAVFEGSAP